MDSTLDAALTATQSFESHHSSRPLSSHRPEDGEEHGTGTKSELTQNQKDLVREQLERAKQQSRRKNGRDGAGSRLSSSTQPVSSERASRSGAVPMIGMELRNSRADEGEESAACLLRKEHSWLVREVERLRGAKRVLEAKVSELEQVVDTLERRGRKT